MKQLKARLALWKYLKATRLGRTLKSWDAWLEQQLMGPYRNWKRQRAERKYHEAEQKWYRERFIFGQPRSWGDAPLETIDKFTRSTTLDAGPANMSLVALHKQTVAAASKMKGTPGELGSKMRARKAERTQDN